MPSYALFGVVGAYAAIAVLTLSLNIVSLWRWPIKAGAIVATSGLIAGTYLVIGTMLGWPSQDRLPERASFLASRIVEPDKFTGDPGVIFLWLQRVDDLDLPIGEPRAYKVVYQREVATEVVEAQRLRFQGREVIGTFDYAAELTDGEVTLPGLPLTGNQADLARFDERPGGIGGMFSLNQDLRAVFEEMPPLPLPDKVPFDPDLEDY